MIKIKKYILRAAKNRILFTFVIVAFVMVLMPIMAEASTSSQAYYRSFINANRNAYGKRYAPAQKLSEGEIDLSTGEVSIDEVDVSLPGKGGLNLDIHRIYSSHETEYYHQYFEMTKKRVVRGKAYPFKVMDGSNRTVYLSFAEEEDLIDTVYTTAEQLNYDNWETDDYGLVYKEYINVRVANGDLLLERNKTMEPDNLNYYKSMGLAYFPKTDANISLSSKSLWKIAMPHIAINECSLRTDIGKIFYYRFSDEKGRVYDLKFYLVGEAEEQIWYPEGGVAVYGSDYTGELTVDEDNFNYILTLMNRENNVYRFELGNLRHNDAKTVIATSISDRFGNKITYNGNEIIDTYGRKLRVSANGIEIYNGNNYKYIVKYNTERIIDADRDPYDVLTIFNKTKLIVSRNTSDLYSSEDFFENTIYVTQAQETDCWLANYYHCPVFLLKEVIYPEGLKVEYKYETTATEGKEPINYPDDKNFLYKVPRVLEKIEYNQTDTGYEVKSKRTFSYEDSGTIFQEIFTPTLAVTENVYYGDNNANKKFVHNFDVFGRLLSQKQTNVHYAELEKKEYMYDYDSDAYEIRSVDKLDYMYYRQEYVKIVKTTGKGTDFVYTAYTSDRKLLVEQIGLQKTTYTYDPTYRFLTGSTRQIDFDRQLKMVGTKTADGKNIAKAETFEVIGETETLQGVTEYTYNQDGTVASETVKLNSNGDMVRTDYTYDYSLFENPQNGKHSVTAMVTTTDASGITRTESNTVEYDLLGNVTKEIDAGGNETEYKYDLMRRVTEEVYADGTKRSIEYNTVGRTVTITEPNGKKFTYEYDPSGNHTKTYMPDADNQVLEEYGYDQLDRKISAKAYIDGDVSMTETYQYDTIDRLIGQTANAESVGYAYQYYCGERCGYMDGSRYYNGTAELNGEYDAALVVAVPTTQIQASWDACLRATVDGVEVFDLPGYFTDVIYRTIDLRGKDLLNVSSSMFGEVNVILIKKGKLGTGTLCANTIVTATSTGDQSFTPPKTVTTYDGSGKVISEEKRDNATDAVLTRDEYSYDFLGNVKEYRDSKVNLDGVGAFTTQTEYNWQGLPVKETNAVGDSKLYTYDLLGRLLEAQDETGAKTMFSYDQLGRELVTEMQITDTETARTEKYYDLSGNVIRERTKNNKAGESATYSEVYYEYDSMHRPTAIKTNDGTRDIYTQYAYDSMGNVTKAVTGQTEKLDLSGEIPQIANITQYEYDRFGNVTKTTDANGLFETAEYNFVGLPITSTDKKGVTTAYTYNKYGSPLSVATAGVDTINYTYNVNNMPISVAQGTNITTYEYDTLGRLTKETENGIVKTYQLDKVGNRILSNVGGVETAYTYDTLNRLTGVTFEGGSAGYTYDKMGRLTGETKGGIETSYIYNKAGWLTNKTNAKDNVTTAYALAYSNDGNIVSRTENGETTSYTYNGLGQLVEENDTLYEYDTRGNRTKMTKDGVVTEYRYDRTNKLMTENTEGVWTAYAYDENGNNTLREVYEITADGTQNELDYLILGYDALNRLAKVQKDGMTAEYTYGIDNMRKSKTVNGTTQKFIWDGGNIAGITDAQGTLTDKYYRGVGLIASYTDSLNYYQTNDHGDVSAWGDVTYNYDAFGNQTAESNGENPFRYTSEIFDEETGFIYLRNRYYDPSTGRFINEDPIRDGLNWYAYCGNNPVMFVDYSGCVSTSTAEQRIKDNASYIIAAGNEFGVNPAILAATIYAEQVKNVNYTESAEDFTQSFLGMDCSVGISQVRISTAKKIEDAGYIEKTYEIKISTYLLKIPFANKPIYTTDVISREYQIYDKLILNDTNIRYAAAYLALIQDKWKEEYPEIDGRTAVLATLYNIGENGTRGPNSNPGTNEFGEFAKENYYKMRELLGLD